MSSSALQRPLISPQRGSARTGCSKFSRRGGQPADIGHTGVRRHIRHPTRNDPWVPVDGSPVLSVLLPRVCVACRVLLRPDAPRGLCSACDLEVVPTTAGAVAPFVYEGPLRRAMAAQKYERDLGRVGPLADLLRGAPALAIEDLAEAIPVPLHRARQRSRGFNPAELLLRRAVKGHGLRVRNRLRRVRATPPQVGLPPAARRTNVAGAFALRRGAEAALRGRHVLLFDDVVTTGATMEAASAPLRGAGARVSVLALLQAVA